MCLHTASVLPEVQIVHAALDVAHVDVETEEVNGRAGPSTEHLKERREAISRAIGAVVVRLVSHCRRDERDDREFVWCSRVARE